MCILLRCWTEVFEQALNTVTSEESGVLLSRLGLHKSTPANDVQTPAGPSSELTVKTGK